MYHLAVLGVGQLQTPFQNQAAHQLKPDDPVQKAVNSGMGFIVGDILAQRLTGEAFDAVRSLELGLYGTLLGMLAIPLLHEWQRCWRFAKCLLLIKHIPDSTGKPMQLTHCSPRRITTANLSF